MTRDSPSRAVTPYALQFVPFVYRPLAFHRLQLSYTYADGDFPSPAASSQNTPQELWK